MVFAQFSDSHITEKGRLFSKVVETEKNLVDTIHHIHNLATRPELVFITGDLVSNGLNSEYDVFCAVIEHLDLPYVVIPGNHDDRSLMRELFFRQERVLQNTKLQYEELHPHYIQYVIHNEGVLYVGLDSLVEGQEYGLLCFERLSWLTQVLETHREVPTVLLMHHPPFETGISGMDSISLQNSKQLFDILKNHPQVRHILCGHVHRAVHTNINGISISICPSSSHPLQLKFKDDTELQFMSGPRAMTLGYWQKGAQGPNLVLHQECIDYFEGPHEF